MKAVKIIIAMLLCGSVYGQTVTPNPGPYQNINTKYQYTWQKWIGGIWNAGKLIQTDSAQFLGETYVSDAPAGDSSLRAANTGWIKRNITPGEPGQPVLAWGSYGNYSPSDPNPYRIGMRDSMPLHIITNDLIRLTVPAAGVERRMNAADKVLVIDTTTKQLYYTDMTGGSSGNYLDSFWRVPGIDSNYYRINGVTYSVKDSTGGGGTPSLTQYRLAIGDASNQLSDNAAITGDRALASDANGVPVASSTTATELGYVNGVTSSIQGQFGTKADTSTVINSGEINWPGALYTTPTTASIAGHKISFAPALASQTSKYVFTNPSGSSGVPSFNLLDSSYLAGMHTQGYYDGRYAAAGGSGWSLTGNAGIDSATQYLGTSDAKPFQIKTAATNRMIFTQDGKNSLISGVSTNDGLFYNVIAGSVQMTGRLFLKLNKGSSNIAIGQTALNLMNTGVDNIGMGYDAGYSITNGTGNVAIGRSALLFLAGTRNYNVGIGYNVGYGQTAGDYNIVIGAGCNLPNATGSGQLNIGNAIFGTGINQTVTANSTPAGAISIGINAPAATALLDLTSTGKGFLQPRMTTTQKNAISSPANGLSVYDTDTKQPNYYDGVTWKAQVGMTFGTAAPAITPAAIGNFFLDTTNKKLYVSTGTASSADWNILN